jgi:polyhydroxybutyrate depolymerase
MKHLLLLAGLFSLFSSTGQTTVNGSFLHNGLNRTYSFYVPAIYDGSQSVPLILNLHGYTSNGAQQSIYGNFKPIADTANFIVAHPDGTLDASSTRFWNAGFGTSSVDDVGFLEALIDTISSHYNIDPRRIYTTGMSNGGYMSYYLVCQSDRFAAMASVTGSMSLLAQNTCSPTKPTPVMEIHGTADATVAYNGSTGSLSIPAVLNYWSTFNNCPTPPTMTNVPDTDPTDGATAEHYVYAPGDGGVTIEHFKVINGAHTWPGATINIGVTCKDFSASKEIWRFFSQFEHPTAGIKENDPINQLSVYPNPSDGVFSLKSTKTEFEMVEISDLNGRIIFAQENVAITENLDLRNLEAGVYLLKADDQLLRIEIIK